MWRLLGLAPLVRFYRHVRFDLPRTTTATAVVLLAGIAAIQMWWLAESWRTPLPGYVDGIRAAVVVGSALAAVVAGVARPARLAGAGWGLGSMVAVAAVVFSLTARTSGWPGAASLVGRWHDPADTLLLALGCAFLVLHLTVLTDMNVARPNRSNWHD